ncbi:toprim domain-containing protein [Prosthecobacter sp.]|uniref:toprim domain-containing protein n=1 Tax=Prosthecobacter sp. TaxID=1965333 RepID=UPI003783F82A
MGRPFIDFTAVKSAVSFEQVLEHYGFTAKMHRTRNGDGLDGPCPIHPEATGKDAFKVTLSKNCWYCHNSVCKCGGNHLDFVAKMENCDAHEAALKMDQWFNLGLAGKSDASTGTSRYSSPTAQPAVASARFTPRQQPQVEEEPPEEDGENKPLNFKLENLKADHSYLAERGLTPTTVAEFGLGFCAKGTMSGRIVIPIHNAGGELVGYAGRWPGQPPEDRPKYKLPAGFKKSAEVFNLDRASLEEKGLPLIVVEGFFDVIKLWQLGFRRVVSIMGSSLSALQEAALVTATEGRSGIILMFDEDEAGRMGRERALVRLAQKLFVRVAVLPQEGAQPDHLTESELHELLD